MIVKWYLSDLFACGHIRAEVVARDINSRYPNATMDCKSEIMLSDFYRTNIMVFQRQFTEQNLGKIKMAKRRGIKTVYDIDDDMLNVPKDFAKPYAFFAREDIRKGLIDSMNEVDLVVSSTTTLAESLGQNINNKITVVENGIDCHMWEPSYASRSGYKRDGFVIGWMASGSHIMDMDVIGNSLERIMKENDFVSFKMIGGLVPEDKWPWMKDYPGRVESSEWIEITSLPTAMKLFDIGLAPLVDNVYNKSKSNIKYLQYGVLGVPCLASSLEPYSGSVSHEENGFLIPDNEDEWYRYMNLLIHNQVVYNYISDNARKNVYDNYSIDKTTGKWLNAFSELLGGL